MPLAGDGVADELSNICADPTICVNINNWLNELALFRKHYYVIKNF